MSSLSDIFIFFIVGPLLLPIIGKQWTWLITIIAGYLIYAFWGLFLHWTSDVTEYGTGYGMLIPPYLIFITILGIIFQKASSKAQKEKHRP